MKDDEVAPGAPPSGPVQLGSVQAGATPFNVDNVSATYRGRVDLTDGPVFAIIKDLPPRELANELLAATLAYAAGLPIPMPILAVAEPDTGIGAGCRLPDQKGGLVFASADIGGASVRQIYLADRTSATEALIGERLSQWSDAGRLYGFDSWIANVDRNAGNLLFAGERDIWLIDHGQGFTGPNWSAEALQPAAEYVNKLQGWFTPMLTDERRIELARDVGDVCDRINASELPSLAAISYVADLLSAGDLEALLAFLADRVPHVPRLATRALGMLA